MTGEFILSSITIDDGRIIINNSYSGTAPFNVVTASTLSATTVNVSNYAFLNSLSASTFSSTTVYVGANQITGAALWSASTGTNSIITNNNTGNLASGLRSFAGGEGSSATTTNAFSFGLNNLANGSAGIAMGTNNIAGTGSVSIGNDNISSANGIAIGTGCNADLNAGIAIGFYNIATGTSSSCAIGGEGNNARGLVAGIFGGQGNSAMTTFDSVILGGTSNLTTATATGSIIIGGTNNIASGTGVVILGMTGFTATLARGTHMECAYVNSFMDFNALTTLPTAKAGRVFFSGTPLFRMMQCTGNTSADWIIL